MKKNKTLSIIVILLSIIVIILGLTCLVSQNFSTMPIVLGLLALINIINGVKFIKDGNKTLGWAAAVTGVVILLIVISQLVF
ncbi:hypothetical protein [Clostridium omnivorum]|uniref:DUF3953 domain-containing protein n=1 Tax=Clostridium omnivorum TaxID=1604902 RepID=A0ABQ5N6F0_9CLOT|nr:hypothetical protein [Clostridium sp. E14]GLC30706.1 hypothetical protein bsdE14_21160 [Clostridium sp. E14]